MVPAILKWSSHQIQHIVAQHDWLSEGVGGVFPLLVHSTEAGLDSYRRTGQSANVANEALRGYLSTIPTGQGEP